METTTPAPGIRQLPRSFVRDWYLNDLEERIAGTADGTLRRQLQLEFDLKTDILRDLEQYMAEHRLVFASEWPLPPDDDEDDDDAVAE